MIPNPWMILAVVAFLAVSHTWAYQTGSKHKENSIKVAQLEATNKAIEQAEKQAVADNELIGAETKVQEKIKIEYRYIREKANANIDKNASYAECGLDADGLRLFNEGSGAEKATAGKSAH